MKSQNLFPAIGANGPCNIHVNFGQSGFVFIEANVKKWGLAPMTGSLAPPPPYGSEQGSILLEAGREGAGQSSYGHFNDSRHGHGRTRSGNFRLGLPTSPGPQRSPTDISLAHLVHVPSHDDSGEGPSATTSTYRDHPTVGLGIETHQPPPPDYTSPEGSMTESRRGSDESEREPMIRARDRTTPPIPSYSDAMAAGSLAERARADSAASQRRS